VRALTNLTRPLILSRDSRIDGGVGTREAAVHPKRLRDRRRNFGQCETHSHGVSIAGRAGDFRIRYQSALRVNWHASYGMPGARARSDEMERLASQ
jgi:hypothetical protein